LSGVSEDTLGLDHRSIICSILPTAVMSCQHAFYSYDHFKTTPSCSKSGYFLMNVLYKIVVDFMDVDIKMNLLYQFTAIYRLFLRMNKVFDGQFFLNSELFPFYLFF
jgi:membrane-bound metal-dependent hydrolase YbcI (DUF457 family)